MRGETTSADGTTIRWLAVGQGPPLVLVPGGLGDEHAFDPLVDWLGRSTVLRHHRATREGPRA